MNVRNFQSLLEKRWSAGTFVCVGLDTDVSKIPASAQIRNANRELDVEKTIINFNRKIIEATHDQVGTYKPNIALYEAHGDVGLRALRFTIQDIHHVIRDVPVILDFKRGDIGNTNKGYCSLAFDYLKADAITINPYMGQEAAQIFLDYKDKGIFVLCRTSNPGADEFQDMFLEDEQQKLYEQVARNVANHWNDNRNCGLVVGATNPDELKEVREIAEDLPILIPGIGAQGGDLKSAVTAGLDENGRGIIINSSRGIIFASSDEDFAAAARRETIKLRDDINSIINEKMEGNNDE